MKPGLSDVDAADRAQFLKLFIYLLPYAGFVLLAGEFLAYGKGWIGGWTLLVLILLTVPAIYVFARILFLFMDQSARTFTNVVMAGGNLPPDPAHSSFESLAVRGFYTEAAEAYRQHLTQKPADHLARVKLADLYLRHLNDPDGAERLYLEIRKGQPSPREDRLASNLLIELYRKIGKKDRLMVELARFAQSYPGTRAAEDAARTLQQMKEELRGASGG
jgi:hypothetical protein